MLGLGVLATLDDAGLTVQLWNLQPDGKTPVDARVAITNLPVALRTGPLVVRRYLVDSTHSNCFAGPKAAGGLEMVEERRSSAVPGLSARMEPMALCLWQTERAPTGGW